MAQKTRSPKLLNYFKEEAYSLIDRMKGELTSLSKGSLKRRQTGLRELFRCAHILRSSSSDVGLKGVHEMAARLEERFVAARRQRFSLRAKTREMFGGWLAMSRAALGVNAVAEDRRLLAEMRHVKALNSRKITAPRKTRNTNYGADLSPGRWKKRIKILVIEDSRYFVKKVNTLLSLKGRPSLALEHAGTLHAGLKCVTRGGIDLILLDLGLPDSEGLSTLARLKAGGSEVPVVVLTAIHQGRLGPKAIRRGAQDYLVKDELTGSLLFRSISYALERHRLQLQLEQKRAQLRRQEERRTLARLAGSGKKLPALPRSRLLKWYIEEIRTFMTEHKKNPKAVAEHAAQEYFKSGVSAREVVEIHLEALEKLAVKVSQETARELMDQGRFLLVGTLVNLADWYKGDAK